MKFEPNNPNQLDETITKTVTKLQLKYDADKFLYDYSVLWEIRLMRVNVSSSWCVSSGLSQSLAASGGQSLVRLLFFWASRFWCF